MNSKHIVSATLAFGIAAMAAQAQAADGTIDFEGEVTAASCTINSGAPDFSVILPTVSSTTLGEAGATAGRTPFTISLTDCEEATEVSTYFEPGPTVDFATGRLINQLDPASDGAQNVMIQLLGQNSGFLPIQAIGADGNQPNSQWVAVDQASGTADLNYYAEYYAMSAAIPGLVESSVQYTISYR